ncbi:hypothetical protein AAFG07_03795 [Bradyrhizobium sp. B097]|uniref:hypothetical protein n=1 Tax=Bradyrhizobium sp. B097 TaxID=3140244 RepID=UPI0031843858
MLLTIQFPLADLRPFLLGPNRRLPKPAWPNAHPGGEFVRGIGGIDFRRLGGLQGWVGEGTHCLATNLVSLGDLPQPRLLNEDEVPPGIVTTRVKFRRLFADGVALAKFELGIAAGGYLQTRDWGLSYDFAGLVTEVGKLQCRVPGSAAGPLLFSGKPLATRYAECSTKRAIDTQVFAKESPDEAGLVVPGDPLIFIDCSSQKFVLPKGFRSVVMPGNFDFQVFFGLHQQGALRVPVWILLRNKQSDGARHLRIFLQRMHAEKEVLRAVLDRIASGKIGASASETLQRYLLESTRRINHLEGRADKKAVDGIGTLAASCLQYVQPGWLDTLMQRLDVLNVRPNVKRNVAARIRRNDLMQFVIIDQSQHDHRRGIFMGDVFSNIQNSTIVNRSTVESAFNKTKSESGEETASILLKVAEFVAKSGNKEAGELLDQFNEELSKPQPRKSLLKRSWDGLLAALPTITTVAGAATAIAKLFT